MDEDIDCWFQLARLDLERARRSLQGESYCTVFRLPIGPEKLLKALVVQQTQTDPPRIHNLVRLAALAGVNVDSDRERFLSQLSLEYVEMRYPEELAVIEELNNRSAAEEHLRHFHGPTDIDVQFSADSGIAIFPRARMSTTLRIALALDGRQLSL